MGAISADYYIYFPVTTPSWKIFLMSFLGMFVMPAFAMTCGAGFATALWTNDAWVENWEENGSVAALFVPLPPSLPPSLLSPNLANGLEIGLR